MGRRFGLSEKVTFEHRLEGGDSVSCGVSEEKHSS